MKVERVGAICCGQTYTARDGLANPSIILTDWLRAFSEHVDVPISASVDPDMLEAKIAEWEAAAIPNPAFDGSITIVSREVVVEYPEDGEAIDRAIADERITEALRTGSTDVIVLETSIATPTLTADDLDAAAAEADRIMTTPVVLTQDDYGFTFRVAAADVRPPGSYA